MGKPRSKHHPRHTVAALDQRTRLHMDVGVVVVQTNTFSRYTKILGLPYIQVQASVPRVRMVQHKVFEPMLRAGQPMFGSAGSPRQPRTVSDSFRGKKC